eukprot:TRINITY_DN122292_c0_g1_i1.p1 TRINITY_DN122292_c0_g1~~TRINITY_DN122292_c0_g1_i1.p1  ORF type:complete len:663 (-),score=98.28 TRINITY_DN122292_c0_g1_i1:146-2074(-)
MAAHREKSKIRFVSFGEAMLRFQPVPGQKWRGVPSAASEFTRTVGGDELNVMVDLCNLGCDASWVSVLPNGPLGDVVKHVASDASVGLEHVKFVDGSMGCYHVFPEDRITHFERKHSAFCTQGPDLFNWTKILQERGRDDALVWMHQSGISPMLGPHARTSWLAALKAADAAGVPVSVDLNHRPALGTLAQLWAVVEPELPKICLLILSVDSTVALAELLGIKAAQQKEEPPSKKARVTAGGVYSAEDNLNAQIEPLIKAISTKLSGPALACVMKTRDAAGAQQRWSVLVDATGTYTTAHMPTEHTPKDECGGGSAWAAGVIHRLSQNMLTAKQAPPPRSGGFVAFGGSALSAIRRGDIMAALSQETVGDHSTATLSDLDAVEQQYQARAIVSGLPRAKSDAPATVPPRVTDALKRLDTAKVIAIVRAKHESRAVERAIELADMGFKAIEVTADSAGFKEGRLMPAVVKAIGDRCLVGVGTIMTIRDLELAATGGAHFALSPVRPTVSFGEHGFVGECHRRGVLAMPAAYTPQEIYECVEAHGALTVKIFPAQLWSPSTLKDLRRIGDYGKYRLCPSGGIDCKNAEAWLAAGAYAVGMGSCLVGKDVATDPNDKSALALAERDWVDKCKPEAAAFAQRVVSK